ncbi:MAG: hypothetical protein ABFS56_19480 [Pseudomonadota bacterium]
MMTEDLNIAGRLTIKKYTPDNQLIDEISVHNDITIDGRELIARLFNKDIQGDIKRVSKIRLGRSQDKFNAQQHKLLDPVTNTTDGQIWQTDISKIEQSQVQERIILRLTGELGEDDCNDELREAGLFTADDVMYNRVTFDTITKSNQFKLTLVWEITF